MKLCQCYITNALVLSQSGARNFFHVRYYISYLLDVERGKYQPPKKSPHCDHAVLRSLYPEFAFLSRFSVYYKRCKRPAYTTTGIMLMLIYQKGYMSLGHCDLLVSVTV